MLTEMKMFKAISIFLFFSCFPASFASEAEKCSLFSFLFLGKFQYYQTDCKDEANILDVNEERVEFPSILFYTDPFSPESSDKYKIVSAPFQNPVPWIKINNGSRKLELCRKIGTFTDENLYKKFVSLELPENTKGALFCLVNANNAKNWTETYPIVIPLREMMNADGTAKQFTLVVNALPEPIQVKIEDREIMVNSLRYELIPVDPKARALVIGIQILRDGKLVHFNRTSYVPSRKGVSAFCIFRNPRANEPGAKPEGISYGSFLMPELPVPTAEAEKCPSDENGTSGNTAEQALDETVLRSGGE